VRRVDGGTTGRQREQRDGEKILIGLKVCFIGFPTMISAPTGVYKTLVPSQIALG
jgi:hypothetical protein